MRLLRIVPTVRWTLRMGSSSLAGVPALDGRPELLAGSASRGGPCACRLCGRTRRSAQPLDRVGRREDRREIQPLGLPMVDRLAAAEPVDAADHVVERAEAQFGHDLPDLLGHEGEEADHVLGLAGEPLAQLRVLGGDADRAGAQVALAHEDAAQRDQGRGAEAEPLGPQQGADDHVAAGLHLAVDLHEDAVAQAVEHQRLLGLGQAELPGACRRA